MWERSSLMQELVQEAADARQEDGQRSTQVHCSVLPVGVLAGARSNMRLLGSSAC